MKILPLVFTLLLILSVLTIEKMENFKNRVMVEHAYGLAIGHQKGEESEFNRRQARLYGDSFIGHHHLTFRPFLKKQEREADDEKYKQFRQITIALIKEVYGKAAFFKKMEQRRPEFVEELLDAIQAAADEMPEKSIRRVQDIARIKLADPQLQEVYYCMLKGTIERRVYKKIVEEENMKNSPRLQNLPHKTYFPLLTFLGYEKMNHPIKLGLACRELLMAIYGNRAVVDKLIVLREELTGQVVAKKLDQKEATEKFRTEFDGKQKQGITDVLDYSITTTSKVGRD